MKHSRLRKSWVKLMLISVGIALLAGCVFCYVNAQEEASPTKLKKKGTAAAAEIPIPELVLCDIMPYFPS